MYVAWAAPGVASGLAGVTLWSTQYSAALQSGKVSFGGGATMGRSIPSAGTWMRVARAPPGAVVALVVELGPGELEPCGDGLGRDTDPVGLISNVGVALGFAATGAR